MSLLTLLLVGLVAGWLAGMLMKGEGFGLFGDIIVGIIGAFLGGWLFSLLNLPTSYGVLGSIVVATIGSVILVFLVHQIKGTGRGITT
jgi:uncharacterized membrane protein YeaQ/YmgE (transglycosylase-associated protein family)